LFYLIYLLTSIKWFSRPVIVHADLETALIYLRDTLYISEVQGGMPDILKVLGDTGDICQLNNNL
jgi:hypothetical protein